MNIFSELSGACCHEYSPEHNDLQQRKIHVTFFRDMAATRKTTKDTTLPELRDLILKTHGPTKMKLRWLKLASFGDVKSEVGCLRHDRNVLGFGGIEMDYDAAEISLAEAIETLRRMGVRMIIYTSPSYTAANPKWRLLIPLSKPETRLEMRAKYCSRVDGFFGNIFAAESYKLSHSYFYGQADDNPDADHQAIIIDGDFLDLRDDLYKYEADSSKKTGNGNGVTSNVWKNNDPMPDWLLLCLKSSPGGLSSDPADNGIDPAEIKAALSVLNGSNCGRDRWFEIGGALFKVERIVSRHFGEGWAQAIWYDWSLATDWTGWTSPKPNRKLIDQQWRSIVRGNGYGCTLATLFYWANKADPLWRDNIERPKIERPEPEDQAIEPEPEPEVEQAEPSAKQEAEPTPKPPEQKAKEPDAGALIISNRKLVANFKPPDYLIEGLLQRRFLYGLTALTNDGKTTIALRLAAHIIAGLPLGDREIEQGKVLFFAGENPDDVTMRWIKLCEEMNLPPETTDQAFWVPGVYSIKKLRKVIDAQTKKCGPFALVVIDSAAAYFEGDEENSNTQLGAYARMLRTLVEISGGPTILVICHPVKNASPDNLIPRGGSAFLNEIDGNLVLKKLSEMPKVVELHWQGKFRGPDFQPIGFMLTPGFSEQIKDSKGRMISTITAKPLSTAEKAAAEERGQEKQDKLLSVMKDHNGASLAELAKLCGWYYKNGDPNTTIVNRTMSDLEDKRLVEKKGGHWKLTKAGLATDTESL